MTLEETRKRILEDDEFVIAECRRLQTFYKLKTEIRYGMSRKEQVTTESVAEHIYALHALAAYFLPLEDTDKKFDRAKVHLLIEFHDIDEIVTGDIVGFPKTPEQASLGKSAIPLAIEKLPESMQPMVTAILDEYGKQQTAEAKFVKALDKMEPSFHVYNDNGKIINHTVTMVTLEKHRKIKDPYTSMFEVLHRFSDVLSNTLNKEGYFLKD